MHVPAGFSRVRIQVVYGCRYYFLILILLLILFVMVCYLVLICVESAIKF